MTVLTNRSRCLLSTTTGAAPRQRPGLILFESHSPVAMISLLIHTSLLSINQDPAKRPVWESRLVSLRNLFQNPWPRNCRNSWLPKKTVDSQKRRNGLSVRFHGMTGLHSLPTPNRSHWGLKTWQGEGRPSPHGTNELISHDASWAPCRRDSRTTKKAEGMFWEKGEEQDSPRIF